MCGTFAPWNFRSLERERKKAKRKFKLIFVCDFFSFFYLHSLMSVQLRITNRSFALCITSSLESTSCLIPRALHKTPCWRHTLLHSPPTCSPLSPSITHSLFCSRLKIHLFHKSFLSDLCICNYRSLSGDRWLKSHYRYDVALFNNTRRPIRAENRNLVGTVLP